MTHPAAFLDTPLDLGPGAPRDDLALLRGVPLFADLSDRQLKRVQGLLHPRTYKADEVVFRQGDAGAGMYVVKHGSVRVVLTAPDGTQTLLARLSNGQFLGEMALLDASPRHATCVADNPTELLGFLHPDLASLCDRDPRLGVRILWNLSRLLAARVRGANQSLQAATAPAPTRPPGDPAP
jgi:CRP-like cAMP-binding protein